MAHFAQLDQNNVVVQVIVVNNNELLDNGVENETKGISFCQSLFGPDTIWVQTSYNSNFRKRYAGVGFTYDSVLNAFIVPKPTMYPSWVVDPVTTDWTPPIPRPSGIVCNWDESKIDWVTVPQPFPSWTMQGDPLVWAAPVPYPDDGNPYLWDEATLSWVVHQKTLP